MAWKALRTYNFKIVAVAVQLRALLAAAARLHRPVMTLTTSLDADILSNSWFSNRKIIKNTQRI